MFSEKWKVEMDIEKLKQEIKAEILKELTKQDYHTPGKDKSPFNGVKAKYAKNKGPLHDTFGGVTYARVWDSIRAISAACVGLRYVRDLTPIKAEKAAEIAEFLCKYVIEQREGVGATNETT